MEEKCAINIVCIKLKLFEYIVKCPFSIKKKQLSIVIKSKKIISAVLKAPILEQTGNCLEGFTPIC